MIAENIIWRWHDVCALAWRWHGGRAGIRPSENYSTVRYLLPTYVQNSTIWTKIILPIYILNLYNFLGFSSISFEIIQGFFLPLSADIRNVGLVDHKKVGMLKKWQNTKNNLRRLCPLKGRPHVVWNADQKLQFVLKGTLFIPFFIQV